MANKDYEYRYATGLTLEKRDGKPAVIVGYPIVFNSLSHDLGGFREIVLPSAVDRTLSGEQDIRAFVEHDRKEKLGRRKTNTLRLAKDDKGVRAEIDIPDTSTGRDIATGLERGDFDGMSFRFAVIADKWERRGGENVRLLVDMEFDEVSVVGDPAYPDTTVALRSLDDITAKNLSRLWNWLRIAESL